MSTTVRIENDKVHFAGLLNQQDHDAWWKGIEPDRPDGSDCQITQNVQNLLDAMADFGEPRIQIWEPGSAFFEGVDTEDVYAIRKALAEVSGEQIELIIDEDNESIIKFPVFKKRDGDVWKDTGGYYYAISYKSAKQQFAAEIINKAINGEYSDNMVYLEPNMVEDLKSEGYDMSFYRGEGVYEDEQLIFLRENVDEGFEYFGHDVYLWTVDFNRV